MKNLLINEKTVVVIPAYEPPHSFIDYVDELSANGFAEILVVNDGSGEKYQNVYDTLAQNPKCTVLSYDSNHGKGYALKHAFAYCKEHFNEEYVFVTADCDGQHLTKDVGRVAKYAHEHKGTLILGSRDFDTAGVPKRSYTGNTFTRRLYKFLYGTYISDTQTGLRGFSYDLLDEMLSIKGERFEYEMNMLILLPKHDYEIKEIPIATVYHEKPEDVDKVSHYDTVKDSLRIAGVLFQNPGWYFISAIISTAIEMLTFFLLTRFMLFQNWDSLALSTLIPTLGARVLSSIFNFIFNYKVVFKKKADGAILRYYILWTIQLAATYGVACGLTAIFGDMGLTETKAATFITLLKALWDMLAGILSYGIQSSWVFRENKKENLSFYGPYFQFCRFWVNLFSPKYKTRMNPPPSDGEKPVVYVGRHLNEHGPIKCLQSLPFDVHGMALNKFFTFSSAYDQFANYTFTKKNNVKGIGVFFAKIGAFFAAAAIAPLFRSAQCIPVYRGGTDSLKTLRKSMEYLDKKENIILFPDVDYTADAETSSDIYTGFLFLDKMYYKKHGEHLEFVVLSIDDEKKLITEAGRVAFPDGDFRENMPAVAEKLHALLMSNTKENTEEKSA